MKRVLALLTLCSLASIASAHVASTGFLAVHASGQELTGSIELALRDAELAVGVDSNNDGRVTWGELRAAEPRLQQYIQAHLGFDTEKSHCALQFQPIQVNQRVDGNYAWVPFSAQCPLAIRRVRISYSLMAGVDPAHRGLLTLISGADAQTAVLGGRQSQQAFTLGESSGWRAFTEYLQAGIWHIWSGIDHLLFLLLPAVLLRRNGHWEPVSEVRPAFINILKVVTAFTLAHSITLSLAALDVVRLPSRLTESVIAASIIIAALNNIFPLVTDSRARIAFLFGLLHGFGFASVLADMGLPHGARLISLVSFNLGIEVGQLAVVLSVMPLVYAVRAGTLYRRTLMPWGSAAIAAIALVWFVQRAFFPT
ncbi:MAG TPA: HupE/UreJ family protein [Steroidobacteraceae bacterium]|nr:HupE/UreJ family protein [Steroidobacteraceae bacterium]